MCIKEGGKLGDIYGNAFVCNGDGSIQVNADGSPVNKTGNKIIGVTFFLIQTCFSVY